jgi:hypothetical protein
LVAKAGEAFDPQVHHSVDSSSEQEDQTVRGTILETVATGVTYQGQLLRRALVKVQASESGGDEFSVSRLNQRRSQASSSSDSAGMDNPAAPSEQPAADGDRTAEPSPASDSAGEGAAESFPATGVDRDSTPAPSDHDAAPNAS